MDQNFSLMAQSRANYYTAGSPVQFVRVELLKGDVTGEVAVCLTFKNVGTEPLTGLVVHFKCKDAAGQVLCEDDFYYEQLNAQPGTVFGSDDAVYVSDTPVSSVEVEQDRAFLNGRGVDLRNYKRVRLNMPRVLPGSISRTLQQRTGNVQLTCVPQDTEYGWFCACGAFHPNEENTTVCSECGGDRAAIKATLTGILEEARQAAERQQQEVNAVANSVAPAPAPQPQAQPAPAATDPRAMANAVQAAITGQQDIPPQSAYEPEQATAAFEPQSNGYADDEDEEAERVRRYAPKGRLFDDEDDEDDGTQMYDTDDLDDDDYDDRKKSKKRGRYADDDESSEDDVMAERIIRLAPPITAIACALIVAVSLVYHFILA
ncbi:hypothetical protein GPK89_06675 [Gemmiger formicilis]|uniref:hypothetical protein n=1 Tax=Gemmiger formicilis TaxID=745368 RepID=UPI001C02065D|nr:hypothetical protein [Gemmiger formicilis]MBT9674409.1 hypothetical protein [Gemmiger formicilis]